MPHAVPGPPPADEFVTRDPLRLRGALERSGRFRRDTTLGGIFHQGKISLREVCRTDSLHITIDGNRISAHVDRISPLNCRPGARSQYSLAAVLAHNLAGLGAELARRIRGRHGRHRCQLECEVVWVDEQPAGGPAVP